MAGQKIPAKKDIRTFRSSNARVSSGLGESGPTHSLEGEANMYLEEKKLKKRCGVVILAYAIIVTLLYLIGGDQFHYEQSTTTMLTPTAPVGEIKSDTILKQELSVPGSQILDLTVQAGTYGRENVGELFFEIYDMDGRQLATKTVDISQIQDNALLTISFEEPVQVSGRRVVLQITAPDSAPGNAVTLYAGDSMSAARVEVSMALGEQDKLYLNGQATEMALSVQMTVRQDLWFGDYYWWFAAAGLLAALALCAYLLRCNHSGKSCPILAILCQMGQYRYLMKQLVGRDFKTKYRRSVLGVCWSFLNPLLTMMVQYVVFSTLFKSGIPNFPLYLLSGIVCFNFFSEATTMALGSIVNNAGLITKVYMPKYIYPLTRVISSTINLLLSLIPLAVVMLITRAPISWALLLLPLGIFFLFCLSLGIGMILSTAMVFFRDTVFLWGVVSMIWMYLTPIFYPESIIAEQFLPFYRLNPQYQIITFIRTILIDGVSPSPESYLGAILSAIIPLMIGIWVFKKNQDKFILSL